MRWITTTGGAVTAASREAAAKLAVEYGMGTIVRPAPLPPRAPEPGTTYVAWDDLCQATRAEGDAPTVARALIGDKNLCLMVWGPRGLRRPNSAERHAVRTAMEATA